MLNLIIKTNFEILSDNLTFRGGGKSCILFIFAKIKFRKTDDSVVSGGGIKRLIYMWFKVDWF